jgi:hypothetical protein
MFLDEFITTDIILDKRELYIKDAITNISDYVVW